MKKCLAAVIYTVSLLLSAQVYATCSSVTIKNTTAESINIFTKDNWKTGGDVVASGHTKTYSSKPDPFGPSDEWVFGLQLNIDRAGPRDGPQACDNVCGHVAVNTTSGVLKTDTKSAELGTCNNSDAPWWSNGASIDSSCDVTVTNPAVTRDISCSCPPGKSTPCAYPAQ